MRNLATIIAVFFLGCFNSNAQEGEEAQNFIITDINGETHELYAYLEEGKTVVIEFFALWCSPCVTRFEEEVGDDVHAARGPSSLPNDIVYISIENDPNTSVEETLYGVIDFDFVEHPVAILEGDQFDMLSQFNGSGYPDVFSICPNKIINRLDNTSPMDSVIMRSIYPRVIIPNDSLVINCAIPSIEATITNMEYNTVYFSWVEKLPSGAATSPPFDYKALNPFPTKKGNFFLHAFNNLNQCGTTDSVVVTKIDQKDPLLTTDKFERVIPCDNFEDTLNLYTNGLFGGGIWERSWSSADGNIIEIFDSLQQHHVLIQGAGTYITTTLDKTNGCETQLEIVVTNAPAINDVTAQVQNASANDNDGAISLTPEGGTAPFQYLWSTGATTPSIQGLSAGIYSCEVTDLYGCLFEVDIFVSMSTATSEVEVESVILVAPNPTTNFLNIKLQKSASRIFLQNMHGQRVKELNSPARGNYVMDVADLPSGTYALTAVFLSGKVSTQKIMITN